ncbi:hypothetical protein GTQ34_13065 [Muricauda sp. JGD-17]|uniref:Cupin domain-containing protein n=1 Tax=Flagellimonas ochracea TaxID=2696472 RepID=A0A964TDD7_9FLAO|nr:hypothetical protein [Allomuricauda ochracea]NAY92847.1 hypothetical protein [Allomuricauda ochracea]
MYTVDNHIKNEKYSGLNTHKLAKTETLEVIAISLEKDAVFPEHVSPKEAQLVVLEGDIDFHINHTVYNLTQFQHFDFPKEIKHWVRANENTKFLIIR